MKVHYLAKSEETTDYTSPKNLGKIVTNQGKDWEYKGKKQQALSCCQKFGRFMMIVLKVIGGVFSLGLAAASRAFRESFAQDVKELKTGTEKHKYFSPVNYVLHQVDDLVSFDQLASSMLVLSDFKNVNSIVQAKAYYKFLNAEGKLVFRETLFDKKDNFSVGDLVADLAMDQIELKNSLAEEMTNLKQGTIIVACVAADGQGCAIKKQLGFKNKEVIENFNANTGPQLKEVVDKQLSNWFQLCKFPGNGQAFAEDGKFKPGYQLHVTSVNNVGA